MTTLREAAEAALEALEGKRFTSCGWRADCDKAITALKAALAEFQPDWDRIEPLQENLREHMAEIQRLRAQRDQLVRVLKDCEIALRTVAKDDEDFYLARHQVREVRAAIAKAEENT